MKRFFMLCLYVLTLTGCGSSTKDNPRSQSVFWENFSIWTIDKINEQSLIPESRQLFGSESGSPEPFTQKQEEKQIQIDPANLPAFITSVRSGTEDAMINNGAQIVGRGSGGITGTSFSISYRENAIYGVVIIWGALGDGITYCFLAIVTEADNFSKCSQDTKHTIIVVMNLMDYLHAQLRLEGKEVVHSNLLRQVEIVPGEDMPLAAVASLSSNELVIYYDEALPSELRDELDRQIPNLIFPAVGPIINVLQSHKFKLEIGHYKTYAFPEHYKDSKADEVKRHPKSDPKIRAFNFGGFTEYVHAIERDGKVVSACVSAKENDRCGEAWVTTDENYRHQGLAQRVVSAWAMDLMLAGKIPFYSHKISNIGSAKLARRLELEPVFEEITISPMAI